MDSVSAEELVARIEQSTESPLERLDRAIALGEALAVEADRVTDHFVGQARESGESWTSIGDRLGVSKQAARKRFADRVQSTFASQFRPRLRACLDQAQREAQADGSTEVGTHHLLAGLLAEGVAAAILEKLGVTAEAIRDSGHRLFGPPLPATDAVPPMSAEAKRALEAAAHMARNNAPDSTADEGVVGTEHLLAVLAFDPGSRPRRILNELHVDIASIKRELNCYLTLRPRRRRRHGGKVRGNSACSFCGRPASEAGQLVAGPGVWICASCVGLAVEVIDASV
jgi:ClpX C4-type zinc finger/Clp amino terminal domain, pathogenicity island component